jgi:hypothetical protein
MQTSQSSKLPGALQSNKTGRSLAEVKSEYGNGISAICPTDFIARFPGNLMHCN